MASGIQGVDLEKHPRVYACLPSFIQSALSNWTSSLRSLPRSHLGHLPAPASEKRPKIEGRTVVSPHYCEWILRGCWLGKWFGDSCRDVFF